MLENKADSEQDARARGNAAAPLSDVRTEGQRALRLVPGSLSVIAGAVGVDKGTISRWRSGEKLPNGPMRQRLQSLYAIAPEAWDRSPLGAEKTPAAPAERPAGASGERLTTLEEVLDLVDGLKPLTRDSGLSASERKGAMDNLGKMLALRDKIEGKAELLESRIVREHPMWRRIERALVEALRPHPAAAEAVAARLAEMEDA